MLTAGLLYGRNAGRNGTNGEGWDRDDRALSLDFFLRLVRALGRHLAPISVPSPLVRYPRMKNSIASSHRCVQQRIDFWERVILCFCFVSCGTHLFISGGRLSPAYGHLFSTADVLPRPLSSCTSPSAQLLRALGASQSRNQGTRPALASLGDRKGRAFRGRRWRRR